MTSVKIGAAIKIQCLSELNDCDEVNVRDRVCCFVISDENLEIGHYD